MNKVYSLCAVFLLLGTITVHGMEKQGEKFLMNESALDRVLKGLSINPLCRALETDDITSFGTLLARYPHFALERDAKTRMYPLWSAVEKGLLSAVQKLWHTPMLKAKQHALILACALGHEDIVRYILSMHPEYRDIYISAFVLERVAAEPFVIKFRAHFTSPLHTAIFFQKGAVVGILLRRGPILYDSGLGAVTPLLLAVRKGDVEIIRLLMRAGGGKQKMPLTLRCAIELNRRDIVELLLEGDLSVKTLNQPWLDPAANNKPVTPLVSALLRGHHHIAEALLERGAEINKADDSGLRAIDHMAKAGLIEQCSFLLRYGSDLPAQGTYKRSVSELLYAVAARRSKASSTEMIILRSPEHLAEETVMSGLVPTDRLIDKADDKGITPLMRAAAQGDLQLVKQLGAQGANLLLRDRTGKTAVGHAARNGYLEIMQEFVTNAPLAQRFRLIKEALKEAIYGNQQGLVTHIITKAVEVGHEEILADALRYIAECANEDLLKKVESLLNRPQ